MNEKTDIPEKERALVLQGGGSLGAYGAGAYRALYESISEMNTKNGNKGKPIFDIVAGTSIGAINAAILVSYVVENKTYEGSAERLIDFWKYLSKESMVKVIHFLNNGGIIGIQLMEKLHLVKLQDDTILLKSLHCMEYQMFLILLNLGMTTSIMIHKIHGIVLVMNL